MCHYKIRWTRVRWLQLQVSLLPSLKDSREDVQETLTNMDGLHLIQSHIYHFLFLE
jgi:hypothetical protein